MSAEPRTLLIIAAMTVAAALCRLVGFWFMRFLPITPRLEAGLKAIPLAVMVGIIAPPVLRGGSAEWVGLFITIAVVRLLGNDLLAIMTGMGAVAAVRFFL